LIVPHAGYAYSGWVAAYGYKTLIGNPPAGGINTVILIGNSHQERFEGASVYQEGYYKTPLGNVEIDKALAKRIINSHEKISFRESAHKHEHSLEVQLPFLQKVLAKGWKIVPIIIGSQPNAVEILINTLKGLINNNTLLIASSDLSHYPSYEDAKYSDNKVIEAILTGKRENLRKVVSELEQENIFNLQTCACGQDAIEVVMGLMGDKDIKLLRYANSGDVEIGDKSQVVGYAAIAFTTDELERTELTKEEQKRLLQIAKETVESYIKTRKTLEFSNEYPVLEKHLGVFVTIKKHGQLRGCIGRFQPDIPLYKVVREMAVSAATEDHRFYPVTEDELDELEYEISALSPLKKVDSWKDIQINKHGVQIRKGLRSGVFLPQVATENNWDLDTFMSVLCQQKAGLPVDCWKDSETEIYVFTAQVF
jgi:AmmeMemoRadiSam system protein B/AmmeMemoRadiSam system protein A